MNAIESLQRQIERSLPAAWTRLRVPRRATGMWWMDAKLDDHVVTVQWSPARGFGVSASALSDGFGEGPEETFDQTRAAAARVLELLEEGEHTQPPRDVVLRELRASLELTQEQVAERLGVQQAAVSRLERREDMTLGSLRRYVAALGATLEITIHMESGDVVRLAPSGE